MEPDQSPEEIAAQTSSVNESRRRFTKSGIAVSGVILTLTSRPVMGTGTYTGKVCKSCSGFVSGNGSTTGPQPVCLGRSPAYWRNHPGSWPIKRDTAFRNIFTCGTPYNRYTMFQLCSHQNDDKHNFGMHIVAAYLNTKKGWTPFLTEERIRDMVSEIQNKGVFSPTAGVYWTIAQCVAYLQATQA